MQTSPRDPLAETKRKIRAYLNNFHELQQLYIAPARTDEGGGGGSFESGAWWEALACMRCDVRRAMEQLTRRQREGIGLVYVGGFAVDEAAELMEIAPVTLWQIIRRGVQEMAACIGAEW